MIRVLHSVSYMSRGGIETMLMNYYRRMDRSKVQFDFLCNSYNNGAYDEEILSMGGRIFRTPGFNPLKYGAYRRYMKQLFIDHPEYKIVEAHNGAMGVYALHAAKRAGIATRIYHAHGAGLALDLKFPIKYLCKRLLKYNMNQHFVCSLKAGEFYMGHRIMETGDFHFIHNAIDIKKFVYNEQTRARMRKKYGLERKQVVGHVGRFSVVKNHPFILRVFAEALNKNPNLFLVLLGDGELQAKIKKQIADLNLKEHVLLTGNVSNTHEWYQAFDLFLMPSLWEGLPVVGVEAQCADLPCIFSTAVTDETALTEHASFISLEEPLSVWANAICNNLQQATVRKDQTALITDKHYNIEVEAARLQELYLSMVPK